MIRDITIGQYYPAESPIHKLDPRVKLFATLIYIIALFCYKGIAGLAFIVLCLAAVIKISKVPFKFMVKGLKTIIVLLVITASFNLFFTRGDNALVDYGIIHISDTGITNALTMIVRLVLLIIGTSLMTLTTTPNQLTDGLEKSMGPLNKIHVPVHAISMMMSDFENGNILRRAKNMVPLLVPLFVSAFRRADDLAMAMEARCYNGGEGRTKMKPLKYEKDDRLAYIMLFVFLIIVIAFRVFLPFNISSFIFAK